MTGLAGLRWKTEYKNNNSLLAVLKPPAGRRLSENPSPPCLSLIGDTLQANSVPLGSSRERLLQIPFLPHAVVTLRLCLTLTPGPLLLPETQGAGHRPQAISTWGIGVASPEVGVDSVP